MAAWISYYKYMRKRLSSYSRRTAVFDKLSTTADECSAIVPVRVSCADSRRRLASFFFADSAFRAAAPIRSAVATRPAASLLILPEKVSYQQFPHTLYPNK